MTLEERIKALPAIKDEAGSECVSREVVLGLVAGAREAMVKEIVALLEHEHGWKLQVPAGDLEPPIKGCWCGFKCDGLDEFNEHLLTVARAAMTLSDRIKAPTPTWSIHDRKTGVYWGEGIFWTKQAAKAARMLLASKYGNNDLRVVRQ